MGKDKNERRRALDGLQEVGQSENVVSEVDVGTGGRGSREGQGCQYGVISNK